MSAQLLSRLQTAKQAIVESYGRRFVEEFGERAILVVEVRDPVHCRLFELDAFYEFSDYKTLDVENIDMTITFRVKSEEQIVGALAEFRLSSYTDALNVFSLCLYHGAPEVVTTIIPTLEQLTNALQGRVIIATITQHDISIAWEANGYKKMFEVPGTKTTFLHKII